MRIGLLTHSASRLGGGVFEALLTHAHMLRDAGGYEVRVFALHDVHSKTDLARWAEIPVTTLPVVGPGFFGYAPGLVKTLLGADLDLLHLHGLWKYPSGSAVTWAKRTRRPYVISPHGMLDPWILGRNSWKKTLAKAAYERRNWAHATLFHALTGAEAADISRATPGSQVEVVPNSVPPMNAEPIGAEGRRDVIFLGRIHPKKNIAALIDGWILSRKEIGPIGQRLIIAGWGEVHDVKDLEAKLAAVAEPSIAFLGPKFGADKAELLRTARFLALPSLSEGLPMAILEAWSAGTPCLMSAGCNLPDGFAAGAAIDSGMDAEAIARSMVSGLTMPSSEWAAMSRAARKLVGERFSRGRVLARWSDIYADLAERRWTASTQRSAPVLL